MSTERIFGIDHVKAAQAAVADSVRAHAAETSDKAARTAQEYRKARDNSAIVGRVIDQQFADEQTTLSDALRRAYVILNGESIPDGVNPPVAPAPEPTPAEPAPAASAQPEPTAPTPTVPLQGQPQPTVPVPTPVAPQPEPQQALGLPPAQEVTPAHNPFDFRRWRWIQWVAAAIGTVLMFFVITILWIWYPHWIQHDPMVIVIISQCLLWVAGLALGFFAGGWVGSAIAEKRARPHQTQTPPAA